MGFSFKLLINASLHISVNTISIFISSSVTRYTSVLSTQSIATFLFLFILLITQVNSASYIIKVSFCSTIVSIHRLFHLIFKFWCICSVCIASHNYIESKGYNNYKGQSSSFVEVCFLLCCVHVYSSLVSKRLISQARRKASLSFSLNIACTSFIAIVFVIVL